MREGTNVPQPTCACCEGCGTQAWGHQQRNAARPRAYSSKLCDACARWIRFKPGRTPQDRKIYLMRQSGITLLGDDAPDTEFMAKGICAGDDRALWDAAPDGERWDSGATGERVKKAKAICAMCPVLADCLAYGIAGDEYGVWGGEYLVNGVIAKKSGRKKTQKVAA